MADAASALDTRPSLLLRIRDPRDAAAWESFVDIYGPLVYGHCRGRGLNYQDAEDVTQNTFTRVAQAIRTFEYQPGVGRFRDWLGAVVHHEILHLHRKKAHALPGGAAEGTVGVDGLEARGECTAWNEEYTFHLFRAALARSRPHFQEETWRAFELVWLEGRPAAEVARELGQRVDWVYVAKSRVLKHLWEQVQELAEDTALFTELLQLR